ncbi:MAG: hypothetical protein PHI11_13750 [Gallionella sp.]|nr:hypothetical protein [Gallionella sp.]
MKNTIKALLLMLVLQASTAGAVTDTLLASGSWTAPAGVTSVTVEAWGGGGAGGGATTNNGTFTGGGGAGGQYASKVVSVVPGTAYVVTVGGGGTGSTVSGTSGSDSSFDTLVVAKGGAAGISYELGGGAGTGSTAGGVGTIVYAGGSGSPGGNTSIGGAGGGGAGSTGNGGSAVGNSAGLGAAIGGGNGGAGLTTSGNGLPGVTSGGGGSGGFVSANKTNRSGGAGAAGKVTITYVQAPTVTSINTNSTNPSAANTVVTWTVVFSATVTGVDASDFALMSAGGVTGASMTSVTGSGTTYTVTANTGTGTIGSLTLKLVDNDTIVNATGIPLGGAGTINGDFTGQAYTLMVPVCTTGMLFCDDFERSVIVGGSNTATAVGSAPNYGAWTVAGLNGAALTATCNGTAGTNAGCAGIDSDIPPYSTPASPRANATRSAYTRWSTVTVTSPVINLAGKTGAKLSFWLRRGSDCFSEWPGNNMSGCNVALAPYTSTAGEEFQVQYLNSANVWTVMEQFPTDATPGETFTPSVILPSDALWSGFKLRFSQPNGSGSGGNGGAAGVVGYDYWHFDNVVIVEVPAVTFSGPFCDTFEGDLSRWDVLGVGDVRIGSTFFANGLHNMDLRWNTVSATTKTTDLSTNSGNDLVTFWVQRGTGATTTVPNLTGSDWPETVAKGLKFEYLNNLGAWVQLGTTFPGAGTQGQIFSATLTPTTNRFTLPAAAKHANFKLRISMLSGSGIYDQDYWHVDDVCVGATVGATDLGLSMTSSGTFSPGQYVSYVMMVSNLGFNADPGPITITDTLPTGLTYAGGSAGWTCGATGQVVSCSQTGGLAAGTSTALTLTATVDVNATAGAVTNSAYVGGQANDISLGNNTATKTDTIIVPGYMFVNQPCTLSGVAVGVGSQCAPINWSPQTAGSPLSNVYIATVNSSNVPIALNTTVSMQFALSCINPVSNAGVQATFYDATTTTLPLCTGNSAIPTAWSAARALIFPAGASSVGPFSFNYDDVGEVNLYMRNSASITQMGHSSAFVVKPAGFVLSAIQCTTVNSANCGAGALAMPTAGDNPAAANAAGGTFIPAGAPFSVTVTATSAQGNATPNYGKETIAEGVKLTPNNAIVSMVTTPAMNGAIGAFTSGVATGTFTWNEVGIITLTPSVLDGDYLGIGDIVGTISNNVGRFYPDHFDTAVLAPMTCPSGLTCPSGGLAYSGQAFNVYVTAKNRNDGITLNYADATGLAKSVTLQAWDALGSSITQNPSGGAFSNNQITSGFVAGFATTLTPMYGFSATLTPPTDIYVRAMDSDNVSSRRGASPATSVEGGLKVVSGRVMLNNVYGSELLPLTLTATAQYYNSMSWVTSSTDNISPIMGSPFPTSYLVGTTGTTIPTFSPASGLLFNGVMQISLAAPTGGVGKVNIVPNAVPAYLPVTAGTATFGVYDGKSVYIYRGRRGR